MMSPLIKVIGLWCHLISNHTCDFKTEGARTLVFPREQHASKLLVNLHS